MLAGIIVVSLLTAAGFFGALASIIGIILNVKKDHGKVRTHVVRLIVFSAAFVVLGGLNAVLIIKYAFDRRDAIIETADQAIGKAIDKTAEYTARSITGTAQAYSKAYNANIIKQFEHLDIRYVSQTSETKEGKKVYEIELELQNNIPPNEQLYFGSIIANKYLLACDADDYVYAIVPLDSDAGFTDEDGLVSLFEFILDREYSKYGKILPGKTKHKILVSVPETVTIAYLQFLNKKIAIP